LAEGEREGAKSIDFEGGGKLRDFEGLFACPGVFTFNMHFFACAYLLIVTIFASNPQK